MMKTPVLMAISIIVMINISAADNNFISSKDSTGNPDHQPHEITLPGDRIVPDTGSYGLLPDSGQVLSNNNSLHTDSIAEGRKPWPTGALFRSALVPGWGQFYNKKYIKSIIYGGMEVYFVYKARKYWKQMDNHQANFLNSDDPIYKAEEFELYKDRRDSRNLFLWLTGLTVFISMFDAYVDAHMADFGQTDKVFEVHVAPKTDRVELFFTYNF